MPAFLEDNQDLSRLVEFSSDAIISRDHDLRINTWNQGAENLFGYTKEEAIGKTAEDLGLTDCPPEEIGQQIIQQGSFTIEKKYRRKDGNFFWGSVTISIARNDAGEEIFQVIVIKDISARKQLEMMLQEQNRELEQRVEERTRELEEKEQRFRAMIENSNDAITVINHNLEVIYRSPASYRISGWDEEDIKSAGFFQRTVHPDDLERVNTVFQRVFAKPGKQESILYRSLHKDGHYLDVELTMRNLTHEEFIRGIIINTRDMTDKLRSEKELAEKERKYRTLVERVSDGFIALDQDWNFVYINRVAEKIVGRSAAQLLDKIIWDEFPGMKNGPFEKAYRLAMESQQNQHIEEYSDVFGRWFNVSVYPSASGISVYFRDVTEQREAEIRARKTEEKYQNLVERITDAFFSLDRNLCFRYANQQTLAMTGKKSEDLLGKYVWDVFPGPRGSAAFQTLDKAAATQQYVFETGYFEPLQLWHETHIYPSPDGYSIFVRDINERKKAELQAQQSEELRKTIMSSSLDAVVCIDTEGRIVFWNAQAERLFGWPEEKIIGEKMAEKIVPIQFRERHLRGFMEYQRTGREKVMNQVLELSALHQNGKEFPIELFIVPISRDKSTLFCAFIRDISDRISAMEQIMKNEQRLRQSQEVAHLGNWELNLHTGAFSCSDETYRIYGFDSRQKKISMEELTLHSHPDDYAAFKDLIQRNSHHEKGVMQSLNHRIITGDGRCRYVYSECKLLTDETGSPFSLYGIVHDITEKVLLEMELQEREKKEQINLLAAIQEAEEKERNMIGTELHDNVNQLLVAAKIMLSSATAKPVPDAVMLQMANSHIQSAINENRKIAHELVTPQFYDINLFSHIDALANNMFVPASIKTTLRHEQVDESLLTEKQKIAVFRIIQEQCTNIIKYAGASEVDIEMNLSDGWFHLRIADNGKGVSAVNLQKGIGLRNMNGRLKVLGGELNVDSDTGKGFVLRVRFPVSSPENH